MISEPPHADQDRELAASQISLLQIYEERMFNENSASFRWLNASLFAANGGGLVALTGSDNIVIYQNVYALAFFSLGLIFSLIMSMMGSFYSYKVLLKLIDMRTSFLKIVHNQPIESEELDKQTAALVRVKKLRWPLYIAGGLSLSSLVTGLVVIGIRM